MGSSGLAVQCVRGCSVAAGEARSGGRMGASVEAGVVLRACGQRQVGRFRRSSEGQRAHVDLSRDWEGPPTKPPWQSPDVFWGPSC
jgi:hypothetical protein